jgi:hypothetical protein
MADATTRVNRQYKPPTIAPPDGGVMVGGLYCLNCHLGLFDEGELFVVEFGVEAALF